MVYNIKVMAYLLCFVAGSFGYFLNMICGFGAGIFSMMFLPYVMESTGHAATLVNILSFLQGIWVCWIYRKKVRWRRIVLPLAAYLVISTLTVYFAKGLSNNIMKLLLGALLFGLSVYFLGLKQHLTIRPTRTNALTAGAIGGVMSALFSIGGPPMSLYYSFVFDDKEEYLGTIQTYFMLTNTYILFLRYRNGLMTPEVFRLSSVAVAGMILGTWLGKKVFDRIPAETVRRLIYIMMAVSGIVMIAETIF